MFHELRRISFDIIHGLYWLVKTGWSLWADHFNGLPYGNPYIAAVAAALVFISVDATVRPRYPG